MIRTMPCHAVIKIGDDVIAEREWPQLNVMQTGHARGWTRKNFNQALKKAPRDVVVVGSYYGQLTDPPHTAYAGALCGVNGKLVKVKGAFEF